MTVPELCQALRGRVEPLAAQVTEQIRAEVPEYRDVPAAEHVGDVAAMVRGLLDAVAAARPPSTAELAAAAALGQRRAQQLLPVSAVIESFHVGYREIWNALLQLAGDPPPAELLPAATLLWRWVHSVCGAVAAGHNEASLGRHSSRLALWHRMIGTLLATHSDSADAAGALAALGYRHDGTFQAISLAGEGIASAQLERLQVDLASIAGTIHCGRHGDVVLILVQDASHEAVVERVRRCATETPLGIGCLRDQLAGARDTITDAMNALGIATARRATSTFEQDWPLAELSAAAGRLHLVITPIRDIAERHPHLAQAVAAYASAGFSVSAAARDLHLHPNSVAYRLARWQRLTGHDPRTARGLWASIAAIELEHALRR